MKFISGMFFIERRIICRLCGSEDTRLDYNNEQIWIPDKNIDGDWTHRYICYSCRYLNNNYCFKCGGEDKLIFHYDNDGFWNGRRICYFCVTKIRK